MKSTLKKSVINAAATVGVGMLSGKENLLFVGNLKNALLFAVVFAAARFAFSEWVRTSNATDVFDLCKKSFGKLGKIAYALLLITNVVTVIAILGGAEFALRSLTVELPLPMFGIAVCAVAVTLGCVGDKPLAVLSEVCVVLSVAAVVLLTEGNPLVADGAKPMSTVIYALFCAATLVGTDCKMPCRSSGDSLATALLTSVFVDVTVALVALFGGISKTANTAVEVVVTVCFVLSASTGVYAVSRAPLEFAEKLLHDKPLVEYVFFALCLAAAMLDVDTLIEGSYAFTAISTTTLLLVSLALKVGKNALKQRKFRVLCVK